MEELSKLLSLPVMGLVAIAPPVYERQLVSLDFGRSGPPIDDLVIVLRRLTI